MEYSQSTSRAYRICAHFLIAGIIAILGLYVKGSISLVVVLVIVGLTLFISTFFISIHADAAEAIEIILLEEEEFNKRDHEGRRSKDFNRYEVEAFESKKRESMVADLKEFMVERKKEQERERAADLNQ